MADKKVSELDAITGENTAADDLFLIVDTSGTVTKKITRAELNNAIEQDVLENISITNLTSDLSTNGNDINFGDNDKAVFGAGSDLEVLSNGTVGLIKNGNATSDMRLESDNRVVICDRNFNEAFAIFNDDDDVKLYHNGFEKFATSASGIDVTGTVTADGLTISASDPYITLTDSDTGVDHEIDGQSGIGNLAINVDKNSEGSNSGFVVNVKGNQYMRVDDGGDISFYSSDGLSQGFFWDASTQRLGLGTTAPSSIFHTEENTTGTSIVRHKNTSNTSGAHSRLIIQNGGTSGGDALINLDTQASGSRFTLGVDRSASKFVIANADKGSFDGSNEAFVITSGGNVGIGTSSPATALEVNTTSPVIRSTHSTSGDYLQLFHNGSGAYIDFSADPLIIRGASNAERMRITPGGDVGIGTAAPSEQLSLYKSGANNAIQVQSHNSTPGSYNEASLKFALSSSASSTLNWDINAEQTGLTVDYEGSEKVRIDSSGRVSINETGTHNDANEFLLIKNTDGAANLSIVADNTQHSTLNLGDEDDFNVGRIRYQHSDNSMRFHTADIERLRIDSSGNVLVADTTNVGTADHKVSIQKGSAGRCLGLGTTVTTATVMMSLVNGNGTVGTIQTNGTATSYVTSSDHRLKQGVEDMTGAIDRVKALAPKRFQFIADADTTVDGFLAHEAQAVVPEAVTGTHNEVDDDGNPVMQGIDQSKLVPLLTGALREAIAKIEDLETRLAALEGA